MDHVASDLCRRTRALAAVAALSMGLLAAASGPAKAADGKVLIFAAASLKSALDKVVDACAAVTGKAATISYAGTSALAKQIEQGAPADIFFSADLDWIDRLADQHLVKPQTTVNLLGNRLVLIAPAGSSAAISIAHGFDLAGLLGDGRLAIANVDAVPAGKYGKASLTALGVWEQVAGQLAQAENVRAALALVATGEAPLGVVYATDAAAEPKVKVVGSLPADSHPPIIYPLAITTGTTNTDTEVVFSCLASTLAAHIFEAAGFIRLASTTN